VEKQLGALPGEIVKRYEKMKLGPEPWERSVAKGMKMRTWRSALPGSPITLMDDTDLQAGAI